MNRHEAAEATPHLCPFLPHQSHCCFACSAHLLSVVVVVVVVVVVIFWFCFFRHFFHCVSAGLMDSLCAGATVKIESTNHLKERKNKKNKVDTIAHQFPCLFGKENETLVWRVATCTRCVADKLTRRTPQCTTTPMSGDGSFSKPPRRTTEQQQQQKQ